MLAESICRVGGGGHSFPLKTQLKSKVFDILAASIPKRNFRKVNFEKKSADDNKNRKNYLACKELNKDNHRFR